MIRRLAVTTAVGARRGRGPHRRRRGTSCLSRSGVGQPDHPAADQVSRGPLPNLATSVNNLAVDLAEAGRRAEGLTAAQEAGQLRRELVPPKLSHSNQCSSGVRNLR
jgi:hypothetical protein